MLLYSTEKMAYVRKAKKTVRRPYRKRQSTANMVRKIAKSVMLRQVETKRHQRVSGVIPLTDVILPDNISRWVIDNCMDVVQGTTQEDCIGTQILASGLAIKLQMRYTGNFAPYFKIFVVEANAALLGGLNSIFENTIGNAMIDNIKKEYRILRSIIVNPMMRGAANTNQQPVPIFRKLWIPLKKKYDFRTNSVTNGVNKNIGIVAVAYFDGNPVNIDVGTISAYSTLYFKDP